MQGDQALARLYRNEVNRAAATLRKEFYQDKITALKASSSREWWKHMKSLMGSASIGNAEMQTLANRTCEGNIELLADKINECLASVSSSLPRLYEDHPVFNIESDIPDDYIIGVITTEEALSRIKPNKAIGPDNVPGFVLRDNASVLAAPLACLFNCSLCEGVVPAMWKSANVITLPKQKPPRSLEKYIRPISLTPIVSKVFESILMIWVDEILESKIDVKQFGDRPGLSTTDALVEMVHNCYKTTDALGTYVRVIFLDFAKAFDLINHEMLLKKLKDNDIPPHILRWMASFFY